MLLTHSSSFICFPIKSSSVKYRQTNLHLFPNHVITKKNSRNPNVNIRCNALKLGNSNVEAIRMDADAQILHAGIGILKFFEGKNIFVTGATGFLGKVIVEKLLRSTPVGKVYILIKAKNKKAAFDRHTEEIINSELLECLKKEHGSYYNAFIREKLIPICGDICEPNLGMDSDSSDAIRRDADIIIQAAGCTTFNERYDLLFDANVNGPQLLMRFAKTCKNLKLFCHFSTAYLNGAKEGIILEKPLIMGENARKELDNSSFPQLDRANEMNMILKSSAASSNYQTTTKVLKKLGQERAAMFGWNNTYQLTKAMGEMVLEEIKGDVPLLTIRPTIIESSYKEPLPGWIQGNYRMFDPVIIAYGKGHLPAFFADPEVVLDVIPVDMVANTTIAAIAKHGNKDDPQVNVYHVGSSVTNPLTFCDAFNYLHEYFKVNPLVDDQSQKIARMKFIKNFDDFSKYTREQMFLRHSRVRNSVGEDTTTTIRRIGKQCNAKVAYAEQMCKIYEFAGFLYARFDTGNTQKLKEQMSKEEQLNFEVDAMNINWRKYFQEIHVPGLKKYITDRMGKIANLGQ